MASAVRAAPPRESPRFHSAVPGMPCHKRIVIRDGWRRKRGVARVCPNGPFNPIGLAQPMAIRWKAETGPIFEVTGAVPEGCSSACHAPGKTGADWPSLSQKPHPQSIGRTHEAGMSRQQRDLQHSKSDPPPRHATTYSSQSKPRSAISSSATFHAQPPNSVIARSGRKPSGAGAAKR